MISIFATTLTLSLLGMLLYFHLWRSKYRSQGAESLFGAALRYIVNISFITSIVLALISLCFYFNVLPVIFVVAAYFVTCAYMALWSRRDEVEFINALSENWDNKSGELLARWDGVRQEHDTRTKIKNRKERDT